MRGYNTDWCSGNARFGGGRPFWQSGIVAKAAIEGQFVTGPSGQFVTVVDGGLSVSSSLQEGSVKLTRRNVDEQAPSYHHGRGPRSCFCHASGRR